MPVRKRGKVWEISVTIGGRRVRQTAGRGATKEDAYRLENRIRKSLLDQRAGLKPEISLEQAFIKYLDESKHLRSYQSNVSHINNIEPYVRGRSLSEAQEVAQTIKSEMDDSYGTINRRLALLRRVCKLAYEEWGWLDRPIKISLLPVNDGRAVFLTPRQVEKLAKKCGPAADAVRLIAYTGLRRSELFSAEKRGNNLVVRVSKSGKPRTIPIPAQVRHIKLPIPLTDALLRKHFEAGRKAAKMPHVRLHDLRHTYASWLIQRGTPTRTVQELLGHSTPDMTTRYTHMHTGHLRAAVSRAFGNNKAQKKSDDS